MLRKAAYAVCGLALAAAGLGLGLGLENDDGGHSLGAVRRLAPALSTGVVTACAQATATGTTSNSQVTPAHTVQVDGGDVSTIGGVTVPGVTVPDATASNCATATYTTLAPTTATTATTTAPTTTTVPPPPPTTTPSSTTANAWVGPVAGTCGATASLAAFQAATACGSIDAAVRALPASGGQVLVRCGSYPAQALTATGKTGRVLVQSEQGRCGSITGNVTLGPGVSYVTLERLTIHGSVRGTTTTGVGNNHVAVTNSAVNLGQTVAGPSINFFVGDFIDISGNTVGPTIPGSVVCSPSCGSPEGIRIGKPSTAPASCTTQVCHLSIVGNLIQGVVRSNALWPASGFGSSPGVDCTNANGCHIDGIHIWGVDGGLIARNRLYGDECQGIFLENTNASLQRDVVIVNNAISSLAGGCSNKGIYISAGGTTNGVNNGFAGHWVIAFNGGTSSLVGPNGCGSCWPSMTVDLVGNDMTLFVTDATGNSAGCKAWGPATATYRYNIWRPGGTNTACGPNDVVASPPFVNGASAPAAGIDLHLGSPPGVAAGFVPAAVCGSVAGFDFEGDPRSGACNAGPDQ